MLLLIQLIVIAVMVSAVAWAAFLFLLAPYLMGDARPLYDGAKNMLRFSHRSELKWARVTISEHLAASTLLTVSQTIINLDPSSGPTIARNNTGANATIQIGKTL